MRTYVKEKCPKICCEVCGENNKATLHRHHIVPRSDINCTNHHMNLVVLCANCHEKTHDGILEIIGIWPSTKPPVGRTLVYKLNGICNIPELESVEPPYKAVLPQMKVKL